VAADAKMTSVPIRFGADGSPQPGKPEPLFDANLVRPPMSPFSTATSTTMVRKFLLTNTPASSASAPVLNLVTNWVAR
jgi:hypothetical protein